VRKGIHPEYKETTIVCACGNTVHTHSSKDTIHVEICSKCHPFYTGKQKLVDSAGRVERFKSRFAKSEDLKTKVSEPVVEKAEKPASEAKKEDVAPREEAKQEEVKGEDKPEAAEDNASTEEKKSKE